MKLWMSRASSWNVVEVVRPQPGTGRDQRHEHAEAHGLQDFLRHLHLERAVAAGLGRERDADGVADALLQQHAERGRRRDDALRAHAGLGEAEMERIVGAPREIEIDRDQILHRRHLGRQDDAVAAEPDLLGALGREQRRLHHRLARHRARIDRRRRSCAFSSIRCVSSSWSSEPQLAPMRTGLPCLIAVSTMAPNWRSFFSLKPTLPGLMRYLSSASAQAG